MPSMRVWRRQMWASTPISSEASPPAAPQATLASLNVGVKAHLQRSQLPSPPEAPPASLNVGVDAHFQRSHRVSHPEQPLIH